MISAEKMKKWSEESIKNKYGFESLQEHVDSEMLKFTGQGDFSFSETFLLDKCTDCDCGKKEASKE